MIGDPALTVPPRVTRAEVLRLPLGTRVGGMAPIGIRWSAVVSRRRDGTRYFRPDKGCPPSEFAPCSVKIDGVHYEVV